MKSIQPNSRFNPKLRLHSLLVLSGSIAILLASTNVAMADSSIGDLISIFNQYKNLANQYVQQISDTVGTVTSGNLQQIVKQATGALGVPDPFAVGDQVEKTVSQTTDPGIGINPVLQGRDAQNEVERQSSQSSSQWVLGQAGQTQMSQENQQTNQAMTNINQSDQVAQQSLTTQEIMRQISKQNAQNALIQQSLQAETQQASRQMAAANMNLANISGTLDTQQREKEQASHNEATSYMTQAAFDMQLWNTP